MINKKINQRINRAINETPIGLLESLKNQSVDKMTEHDSITRQELVEERKRPIYLRPIFTLATAACIFLIAYFGWYTPYIAIDSIIYFDVNPSIEMLINKKEQVLDLIAINSKGRELIENIDYRNRHINDVTVELLDNMLKQGYIDRQHHAILVSVLNEDLEQGNKKVSKINQTINSYFKDMDLNPIILRQSIVSTNTIEEFADKHNISVGKMTFIKNLMILNPEFQIEDLVNLSIEELITISREKGLDLSKIIDFDEDLLEDESHNMDIEYNNQHYPSKDDDKSIPKVIIDEGASLKSNRDDNKKEEKKVNKISPEEAKTIALKLANGEITDFELDEDDGRLIYEIEIKTKDSEHEIKIDAYTGKVLEHEIDQDDDDD